MQLNERYRLSCRDIGIDDDLVLSGKTKSDIIIKMLKYAFRVHGIEPKYLRMTILRHIKR